MGEVLMHPIDGAGSDAATVNGHTVESNVPADAKFTDTTYSNATTSVAGLMSAADKAKLDGIGAGSNVKSVNGKTGAVTLAKSDVGLSSVANLDQSKAIKSITRNGTTFTATALDGTTSTFTQQDTNTTYGVATASADGLMSKSDKAKLDGITGQVTADKVNAPDHTTDLVQYGAFQITAQQIISRIPDYGIATSSAAGLMSAADKTKLDSIDPSATGDSIDEATMNFTSSDVADGSATAWTSVPALASGEKHNAILGKVSLMFKNVRYLFKMLGTTDISGIGDGTATGAISSLSADLAKQKDIVNSNASAIANNVPAESAWAMADIDGTTVTLLHSHNVESIVFSRGRFRVTFSRPFQGAYYAAVECYTDIIGIADYALDGFSIKPGGDQIQQMSVIALR